MVAEEGYFARHGFPFAVETVRPERLLAEGAGQDFLGWKLDVLEIPGHCDGSLCFYSPDDALVVGGDVLFAGGVGRWDLPGGNFDVLMDGIRGKLLTLPPSTEVWPGHGPATTIGREMSTNPFLAR